VQPTYQQPQQGYGQQPAQGYPSQPPQYGPPPGQYPPPGPPQGQPAPAVGPRQFTKPQAAPSGDRVTASALNGHLLIVVPVALHPQFFDGKAEKRDANNVVTEAAKPPADACEVNIVDLDAPGADGQPGRTYLGVMWGGKVLAGGLAQQIGQYVLGRMGKGSERGGNAAPNVLLDESENGQSLARAADFLARRPNWEREPSTDDVLRGPATPAPAYGQPAQGYPPQPGMPAQGMPPQYGQPQQYGPPQGYPPNPAYPAGPQGYPPQRTPGYPPQPGYGQPPAYAPGVSGPGSPEATAAYGQMAAQQNPGGYYQQ
jgi:hypothetical protein